MDWKLQQHMGFIDMSDLMADNVVFLEDLEMNKILFFRLVDLTILNAFLIRCSCGVHSEINYFVNDL
jgi:hypothetical protein